MLRKRATFYKDIRDYTLMVKPTEKGTLNKGELTYIKRGLTYYNGIINMLRHHELITMDEYNELTKTHYKIKHSLEAVSFYL